MEFLGILAVVGIVISFFVTSRTAAQRKNSEGGQQGQMGENFPFPSIPVPKKRFDPWDFLDEQDQEQASEGRRIVPTADEMEVDEAQTNEAMTYVPIAIPAATDEMVVTEAEPSTRVMQDAAYVKNGGVANKKFDFDLRQAVIYNEILKPKYLNDDHIL